MSKRCFNAITNELRFTNTNPPPYVDKFWQIRQMVKAWNDHTTSIFLTSWEICLYESMSIWNSRWTFPGWIFCPWKPHPFGNEWHTDYCALSGILFVVELVEGKERPQQSGPLEFKDLGGKTVGLLLHIMKSYFATVGYLILDYCFCVLKWLIQLRKKGIFACAVIKKRRYWTSVAPGKETEDHSGEV